MKTIIATIIALACCGCVSQPTAVPDATPLPAQNDGLHGQVRGVFCGVLTSSPKGNNPCPGADVDAIGLGKSADANGVDGQILLTSECTWAGIKAAVMRQSQGLKRGDMLVLTLSGHGAQLPDDNGDEADGIDEALVLYTADPAATADVIRDDRVMSELLEPLWKAVPGLDVLLITDTCFSQGNFRALWSWVTQAKPKARPLVGPGTAIDGALIQIAMSREGEYSYGTATGGTGTQTLLAMMAPKAGRLQVFSAMKMLMSFDKQQVPQWTEFGNVSELFRNGEFWR
jgi:hypothetical protein